jgi:membrane fusion protein (multidrug efflux system)
VLWASWFAAARVGVYAVSATARLEVDREHHPVGAPVAGRVVSVGVTVGQRVSAGDVLVSLDATAEQLAQSEEQARLEPVNSQIALLGDQLDAQVKALEEEEHAAGAAIAEANARVSQSQTAARFAAEEAARLATLHTTGLVSELDALRARNLAAEREDEARSAAFAAERILREFDVRQQDRRSDVARLRRERAQLQGIKAEASAAASRIGHDIDQRTVRAPISGTVAELAPLTAGSVVGAGDRLGTIVPDGEVRVVAFFSPSEALGRIAPGQPARVKLDAFPWMQFGTATALVAKVAAEPQDGQIRVELTLQPEQAEGLSLQHGLPAEVEVEVERVSPATLVLRSVGAYTRVAAMQR